MKFGTWIGGGDISQTTAAANAARQLGFDGAGLNLTGTTLVHDHLRADEFICVDLGLSHDAVEVLLRSSRPALAPLFRVDPGGVGWRPTSGAINRLAQSLLPAADAAAERGVKLLLQNSAALPLVRDLWTLLDRCNHPAVGCCWDASLAARSGEGPSIGVPVLNSRIALVSVRLTTDQEGFEQGDRAVEELVHRLRGIGYTGFLLLEVGGNCSSPALARALEKLRMWNKTPAAAARKGGATAAPAVKKAPAGGAGVG
jgi:hypothetical protein